MSLKNKLFNLKILIIIVFVLRIFLSWLPPMEIDHTAWRAWSARMVEVGPTKFYSPDIFTANPPGFLYVFWLLGEIKNSLFPQLSFFSSGYDFMLKLPNNIADLAAGVLIYLIIKKRKGDKLAKLGFLLYTLNPAIWFNSSVFGQFDGSGAFFGLLAAYLLLEKKKIFLAAFTFAFAWAIKPQAIALAPALGLIALFKFKPRHWFKAALIFIVTTLLIYWPFFPHNPLAGVVYVFQQMTPLYSCTTCFTFNFWGLFGNWRPDTALFLGLPFLYWGIILFGLSLIFLFRFKGKNPYLFIALSVLSFNMLMTRMHERYLLPFFAFFLIAAILLKSKPLLMTYIFFSLFNTLNVYYSYAYYNTNLHLTPALTMWLDQHFQFLSLIASAAFVFLLLLAMGLSQITVFIKTAVRRLYPHKFIILLLILTLFFRLFRLGQPPGYVFDEVYHAFTAQEMAKGNPQAWEWWVTPPPGVAYEWTHPPLAKLAMAGSIKLLGDSSFAWRFPSAVFGTLSVAVLYFLALTLFHNRSLALLAAAIFSFDNLQLTMSRVGMADSLLTLLILLASLFFYQSKFRLTGIFLGLALATKWSAALLYPIFGLLLLPQLIKNLKKIKFLLRLVYSFLLIPLVIYFLCFIPFFMAGHTLAQWWELQRQMYYYHSHLNATHQYQSMAWQWPLLIRPVWFYVNYLKDSVANIYNLGNPAVFWGGLVALFFSRNFYLLIFYFLLFSPFIFSPRIMFLHHYLPALPFLCLIIAQVLIKHKKLIVIYFCLTVILFLFFYPLNTALPLPTNLVKYWFWLPTWR